MDGMGDAASTLISGPTEEALREAAQEEKFCQKVKIIGLLNS